LKNESAKDSRKKKAIKEERIKTKKKDKKDTDLLIFGRLMDRINSAWKSTRGIIKEKMTQEKTIAIELLQEKMISEAEKYSDNLKDLQLETVSLDLIRNHLHTKLGDIGVKIFHHSKLKLNIEDQPTMEKYDLLRTDIRNSITRLYGEIITEEIFNDLRIQEAAIRKYEFESDMIDSLNDFIFIKGIPRDSEIQNIINHYGSNCSENDINECVQRLRQTVRNKIILALKDNIIKKELNSFFDIYNSYTIEDLDNFTNYLKMQNLVSNKDEIINAIETERVYKKFKYSVREETCEEKICSQYLGFFHCGNKLDYSKKLSPDYDYVMPDDSMLQLLNRIENNSNFKENKSPMPLISAYSIFLLPLAMVFGTDLTILFYENFDQMLMRLSYVVVLLVVVGYLLFLSNKKSSYPFNLKWQ
jgi:hypothetical protein